MLKKYRKAVSRRRREISRRKRADCKGILCGEFGLPKNHPLVELLIVVALLMHLEAPEANAAIEEIQNNADCAALITASAMKRGIAFESNPVREVLNYLRTALDFGIY